MERRNEIEALLQSLVDNNKFVRRKALRELKEMNFTAIHTEEDFDLIYPKIEAAMFTSLSDNSEINRMEATQIYFTLLEENPLSNKSMCTFISVVHHRIGKVPFAEDSEDVKMELLKVLNLALKDNSYIEPCLSDVIDILVLSLAEKSPEIIFLACECVKSLAVAPKCRFYLQSASLIKPLIKCLTYSRFKVRCMVIEIIGDVLIRGDSSQFEKLTEPLGLCVKDIPQVRLQLVKLGHRFAMEFSERYSYWPKILPLILFGLRDTDNEISTYTGNCWVEIGAQYEKENEEADEEIKYFMLKNTFIDGEHQYGIGCQLLVQKSLSYLIPCIKWSVDDWQSDTRLKSTELLTVLITNGQESIVQYSTKIVPILCMAAADKEKEICAEALYACKCFAFFVSPKIYLQILAHHFESKKVYDVFLAMLSGTSGDLLREYCTEALELLQLREFCFRSDSCAATIAILTLLASTCDVVPVCADMLLPLLYFRGCPDLDVKVSAEAIEYLANKCGFANVPDMMDAHSPTILKLVAQSASIWDESAPEFVVFISLSQYGGIVDNLETIEEICTSVMGRKNCPIVQYKLIESIHNCILKRNCPIANDLGTWIASFINRYISPLLPWSGGKTAGALRTAAISFLLEMSVPSEQSSVVCQAMKTSAIHIPQLITDESEETRYITCKYIKSICENSNIHLDNKIILSFAEILIKRLDDKKRPVRLAASETLLAAFFTLDMSSLEGVADLMTDRVEAMLIYLDEDDSAVRQNIYDALRKAGEVCPQYLLRSLQKNGGHFRQKDLCIQLANELSVMKLS